MPRRAKRGAPLLCRRPVKKIKNTRHISNKKSNQYSKHTIQHVAAESQGEDQLYPGVASKESLSLDSSSESDTSSYASEDNILHDTKPEGLTATELREEKFKASY